MSFDQTQWVAALFGALLWFAAFPLIGSGLGFIPGLAAGAIGGALVWRAFRGA